MRLANALVLNERLPIPEQLRTLQRQIDNLYQAVQGRISFGTGVDGTQSGNIEGEWQEFTSDAMANTEFSVTHTIGSIPLGYIIVAQDKAGSLYQMDDTGTAWTSTTIYLKCSVASVTFLTFLVKKGALGG